MLTVKGLLIAIGAITTAVAGTKLAVDTIITISNKIKERISDRIPDIGE